MENGKLFTPDDAAVLEEIILNRRDVRGNRFLQKEVEEPILYKLLSAAVHAPSVGFSQPWEFVVIQDAAIKQQVREKEAGHYSVVCAIQNIWLMARALNIGMGWVSILAPEKIKIILNAPAHNHLIAYLCIGCVDRFLSQPELEELQWERRKEMRSVVYYDKFR